LFYELLVSRNIIVIAADISHHLRGDAISFQANSASYLSDMGDERESGSALQLGSDYGYAITPDVHTA